MKKSLIILVLSILAMSMPAQAEHLKFMGIPLTGTITQFQQKLAAKGIVYNKMMSEEAAVGVRWFSGNLRVQKQTLSYGMMPIPKSSMVQKHYMSVIQQLLATASIRI